jgi:glycosyltransferase involved in cell wall biosynthesis
VVAEAVQDPVSDSSPLVSIVAPLYNEEDNVAEFVAALKGVLGELQVEYEIILVDDGSRDRTWQRIREQHEQNPRVRGLSLSRNFGHQNALFAGLHYARGEATITMDGDLQHPPALIPQMLAAWKAGHQVVTTVRSDSIDTGFFKQLTSRWFYRLFSRLTGVLLSTGMSDFRLLDKCSRAAILEMRDTDLFLRGMVSWLGFSPATIPFQADPRNAGKTKYTLKKMVRLSTGAMLAFSMIPLKLGIWVGFATSTLAFAEIIYVVVQHFRGNTVAGWASVMTVMSLMFGVSFILLGTIGLYLGKIFEILKGRQRFVVSRAAGLDTPPAVSP